VDRKQHRSRKRHEVALRFALISDESRADDEQQDDVQHVQEDVRQVKTERLRAPHGVIDRV
jgi:hypothetical protein